MLCKKYFLGIDSGGQCFKLYDILRIDHFRGFAGYYVIPAGDTTAKNGGFCGVNVYICENRQK
ncbi:MAG: 4-alpha-glucanotransferase [Clostridia bacterium]|nr:4-alpha-glucanotransferase [Clostridia bacterium]